MKKLIALFALVAFLGVQTVSATTVTVEKASIVLADDKKDDKKESKKSCDKEKKSSCDKKDK